MTKSNLIRFGRRIPVAVLFGCGHLSLQVASAQDGSSDTEEIFELSPFTVTAEDSVGYQATSTLAGTRLRSDLRDIGSAISVVTAEFLEDTGATSVQDLLTYTTSTEVGGALGNFTGGSTGGGGRSNLDSVRENPDSNNRVRGLASATLTRDFFVSDLGFDSYNTDRVTISRGPNSILYGVGSPGGVVDNSLKRAFFGKDSTKVSIRFGQRGTRRATLDVNKVLVEDRLAVRLAAMTEKINFRQDPAFEEDSRYYGTLTAKLFKNENVEWLGATTLRVTGEKVAIESTPVNPLPMSSNIGTWFGPPTTPEIDAITGRTFANRDTYAAPGFVVDNAHAAADRVVDPGSTHLRSPEFFRMWGLMWTDPFTDTPSVGLPADSPFAGAQGLIGSSRNVTLPDGLISGGINLRATRNSFGGGVAPGFTPLSVPKSAIDFENLLLTGHTQNTAQDFEAYNFTLEQNFFNNKAGIELVFDSQERFSTGTFPFGRGRNSDVAIDVGLYTTSGDLNPNVGRPIMTALNMGDHTDRWSNRENTRFTAFYDLDFTGNDGWAKHLGRHVFTGLYNESEHDSRREQMKFGFTSASGSAIDARRDTHPRITQFPSNAVALVYVGDDQRGATSIDDIRLYDRYIDINFPSVGDEFDIWSFNRGLDADGNVIGLARGNAIISEYLNGGDVSRQTIDSQAFTLQSKFLGGNLVTTYGWREDEVANIARDGLFDSDRNPDNSRKIENLFLGSTADLDVSGQTTTAQAVLHVPGEWTSGLPGKPRISFHAAESENFEPRGTRRNILNQVIGFPGGETEEIGFSIGLAEGKANFRFNWYETNATLITDNSLPIRAALNWPDDDWLRRWANSDNRVDFTFADVGWDPSIEYSDGAGGVIPFADRDPANFDPTARGAFNSFEEVYTALGTLLPEEIKAVLDIQRTGSSAVMADGNGGDLTFAANGSIQGLAATADNTAEGFEFEAIFNPTRNWRIAFNAAKQETVQSNTGPAAISVINDITQRIMDAGLWNVYESPAVDTNTIGNRWSAEVLTPLAASAAKEGTVSQEQRKWRWNAVTNYSFSEGALNGFSVGAAARWQDGVATGYPLMMSDGALVPVLDSAFIGPSQLNGDVWFSYKRKLRDKINWKVQLNVTNAFGDDDTIPVVTNPDGTIAVFRASVEKRWFITNSFEF